MPWTIETIRAAILIAVDHHVLSPERPSLPGRGAAFRRSLWFGQYLPMVDLPQHAAQIAALEQIRAGNVTFTQASRSTGSHPTCTDICSSILRPRSSPSRLRRRHRIVGGRIRPFAHRRPVAKRPAPTSAGSGLPSVQLQLRVYWGSLSYMVAVPFALLFRIRTIRFARSPISATA